MTANQLTLDDLVRGLEHFGSRYDALDVFVRDIKELGRPLLQGQLGELRLAKGEPAFLFDREGRTYKLRFHPYGIARLTRAEHETPGLTGNQAALGLLRAALGTAYGATILDRALPSAVLGFLIGAMPGEVGDTLKRVFTMHHDEATRTWRAYDGPLARQLREKALEADAALSSSG